jgi:drug/metabolite transporter (DMT)-like permease
MLGLGVAWGCSFLFIEVVVDETGAIELAAGRIFFGMLAVGAYIAITRRTVRWSRRLFVPVSLLSIVGMVIPFSLIAWGQEHIDSGVASVLNSTLPVFTAAIAAAVLPDEEFTPARLLGLTLAVAGMVVLTGDEITDVTDSGVLGQLAVVGAAGCYGIAAVVSRNLLSDQEPAGLSFIQLVLATVYSVPLLFIATSGDPNYDLSAEAWASLVAVGAVGAGAGVIAYLWLIEMIGSVRASLVTYIVPVVAVFLGWAVLDESVTWNTIAGGVLIVAGVASVMRGQVPVRERPAVATSGAGE